jgi:hypothetical protein
MWIDKDLVFLICSYTMDVKLEKAEDVITHKLLLDFGQGCASTAGFGGAEHA